MREVTAILAAYDDMKSKGHSCVLATVVHVEGSAYRQAGARMLIGADGRMTGSISGGCLEGDALKKALLALHQGRNKLVTYDTNDEADAIVGAQLGCNGVVQVLFEPLSSQGPEPLPVQLLRKVSQQTEPGVIVTLFNLDKQQPQPGTQLFYDTVHGPYGALSEPDLENAIEAASREALEQNRSVYKTYQAADTQVHAFLSYSAPPVKLVLVGAGNDAQILAQMAALLGWTVVVADGRPTHANPQRFYADCQIVVTKPEKIFENISIDKRTAIVLMTHNYLYDKAVLQLILSQTNFTYIGILGPKKRYHRMLEEFQSEGVFIEPAQLSKIYAPVGLHLGSEIASEIGLSILSEIMAVMNQTSAGHLREKPGPIHEKRSHEFLLIER